MLALTNYDTGNTIHLKSGEIKMVEQHDAYTLVATDKVYKVKQSATEVVRLIEIGGK